MKHLAKNIFFITISVVAALLMAYTGFMVFVFLECPCITPNEKVRMKQCRHFMRILLSNIGQFDTVQEAADQFRHFEDPWGHNYNAIVSDEFSNVSFGNISGCSIIMWSSGPNGINENGQGDDVMVGDGRVGFNKGND